MRAPFRLESRRPEVPPRETRDLDTFKPKSGARRLQECPPMAAEFVFPPVAQQDRASLEKLRSDTAPPATPRPPLPMSEVWERYDRIEERRRGQGSGGQHVTAKRRGSQEPEEGDNDGFFEDMVREAEQTQAQALVREGDAAVLVKKHKANKAI